MALQERGFQVFIPFGENTRYDLVIDDGTSLEHQRGEWQAFRLTWNDGPRKLGLSLAPGSHAMTGARDFVVACHGNDRIIRITFNGDPMEVAL